MSTSSVALRLYIKWTSRLASCIGCICYSVRFVLGSLGLILKYRPPLHSHLVCPPLFKVSPFFESCRLSGLLSYCMAVYVHIPITQCPLPRGVIDMEHIDISITLLKQYSILSLVNAYRNVSKYQKHENGHLEKKLRAEYCWCC